MTKSMIALSAVFATTVFAMPATAQAQDSTSVRVSYADLNLASGLGQDVLQRRMANAARTVCVIEDSKELALASAAKECRRGAMTRAQPAYDAALAAARRGVVTVIDAAALVVTDH